MAKQSLTNIRSNLMYSCSIRRSKTSLLLFSFSTHFQIGFLSVVEAPDILYNETSNDTIVPEGYDVNLRCEARGFPEPTVTWRREGGALIALRDNDDAGKTIRGE